MTDRLCKNCIHSEFTSHYSLTYYCYSPQITKPNLVAGGRYAIDCTSARMSERLCGSTGIGWEEKPPEPKKVSLFERFKNTVGL